MAPSVDSSVLELRLRLYMPDPPDGAVEAYLAAVRERTPPTPEVRPRPDRARHRPLGAAGITVGLLAVAAVGIGMAWRAPAAATVSAAPPASRIEMPPVPGRPIGELMGGGATTGLLDAHGVRAVVSVFCSGNGTIELRIGTEPPIVLTCETGGPALAMLESTEDLGRFTLSVAPQPHVRWSLAVGAIALPTT